MQDAELQEGRATPEGTRRFAARFPGRPGHFRAPDGLVLSSLGVGTKGGASPGDELLYRAAIPEALRHGINVIDTALSYRSMASERTVGAALGRALREGTLARDEVYVITKGGYLTVDPDSPLSGGGGRRYLIETYVESGLVDPTSVVNGVHSLDPRFIRDQIQRSRANLGLATLDLYCLQEPELQLLAHGPTEFHARMAKAFEVLEGAVARGEIAAYGLSTWSGLLTPHLERGHLALTELFELALDIGGGDHHLRAVQLPYSLALGEAQALPSQFGADLHPASALETLEGTGTMVFTTVPLVQGRVLRRLPRFVRDAFPELETEAQCCLQFARSGTAVTTTLVGMRQQGHVHENAEVARIAPADPSVVDGLFQRAQAA